jgi:hypothetical protein
MQTNHLALFPTKAPQKKKKKKKPKNQSVKILV